MELRNERNSFEKKIQVSSNLVSVSLPTAVHVGISCYAFIETERP